MFAPCQHAVGQRNSALEETEALFDRRDPCELVDPRKFNDISSVSFEECHLRGHNCAR